MVKKSSEKDRPQSVTLRSGDALLIIDTINDLEFPGGEEVLPWALKLAANLSHFCPRVRRADLPVIYVNDNFGHWHSSFEEVYAYCSRRSAKGREVATRLRPAKSDYFILKPRHSAFFSTSLVPLLEDLKIERLILSGIATNLCVLFTAHDAHMHRYPLIVLSDCCAAESDFDHNVVLSQLERFCGATVCKSTEVKFSKQRKRAKV